MTKKEMHRTAYSWACELYAAHMPYEHIVAELQDLFPADVAELAAELAEPPMTDAELTVLMALHPGREWSADELASLLGVTGSAVGAWDRAARAKFGRSLRLLGKSGLSLVADSTMQPRSYW